MNHIYKTVWNKSKQMFVVASEVASAKGKSSSEKNLTSTGSESSKYFAATLTALASMLYLQTTIAATTIATGSTLVHNANNGVQVIDIAAANQAGVSHNRYVQYNVSQSGQVLNNAAMNAANMSVMTNLAGKIHTNANLKESARLILNEVTGTQRSALNGFIEIVGNRADLVIANPYGITCTGCGFINTDKSILTTGKPNIGLDGKLKYFDVTQGDITINGGGLEASQQSILKLIARNVSLDGQVNAQDLGVVTGVNEYNFESGSVEAKTPSSIATQYAIDSTQLGGIYANRISLLATEQGVGVRMAGDAAANSDEFILTSAGTIELKNQVSAHKDLSIQNYQNDENALKIEGGLTAQNIFIGQEQDQSLDVNMSKAKLYADQKIDIAARALDSQQSELQSKSETKITVKQDTQLNETKLTADQGINLVSNGLDIKKSELNSQADIILTTNKNLNVGNETKIKTAQNTQLISNDGNIQIDQIELESNGQVVISSLGDVKVGEAQISTTSNLNIAANSIEINAKTNASNTQLIAEENLSINKNADLVSQEAIDLNADDIHVLGKSTSNHINITAINNIVSGLTAEIYSPQQLNLNANNIDLNGIWGAKEFISTATNQFNQMGTSFAEQKLAVNAKGIDLNGEMFASNMKLAATDHLNQQKNSLISVEDRLDIETSQLELAGSSVAKNITVDAITLNQDGYLTAVEKIDLNAQNLVFNNTTIANELEISATQNVINNGKLIADKSLKIDGENISFTEKNNASGSAQVIEVKANKILNLEQGSSLTASQNAQLNAQEIDLAGYINAQNLSLEALNQLTLEETTKLAINQNLNVKADDILSHATILTNDLDVDANKSLNMSGVIQAQNNINVQAEDVQLNAEIYAKNLDVASTHATIGGETYLIEKLKVSANDITQQGLVFADTVKLTATENLIQTALAQLHIDQNIEMVAKNINLSGLNYADQNITLKADENLTHQAKLKAANALKLTAKEMTLSGLSLAGNAEITATGNINQTNQDLISIDKNLTVSANSIDLEGEILATDVNISAIEELISKNLIQARNNLDLAANNLILSRNSKTIAQNNIGLNAANKLTTEEGDKVVSISAGEKVSLVAKDAHLGSGIVAKNVDANVTSALKTEAHSLIQAAENLNITSKDKVEIGGILFANQQSIDATNQIKVDENAEVLAIKQLILQSDQLLSSGKINNSGITVLKLNSLNNSGRINSNSFKQFRSLDEFDANLNIKQFENNGFIISNDELVLNTENFSNLEHGLLFSNTDLKLAVQTFNNKGEISAINNVNLTGQSANGLVNDGTLSAGKGLEVSSTKLTNNETILADNVTLTTENLINNKDILGTNINAKVSNNIDNHGEFYASGAINFDAGNTINNTNQIVTGADGYIDLKANKILNTSKNIQVVNDDGTKSDEKQSGLIYSHELNLKTGVIENNGHIEADIMSISVEDPENTNLTTKLTNNADGTIYTRHEFFANNLSTLNNNGKFYISTIPEFYKSFIGFKQLINNAGAIFSVADTDILKNSVDSIIKNSGELQFNDNSVVKTVKLENDKNGKINVDQSDLYVTSDYNHYGQLHADNNAYLEFKNIEIEGESKVNNEKPTGVNLISLTDSTLNVTESLINNDTLRGFETAKVYADKITNSELIHGAGKNGNLHLNAKTLVNEADKGILALGNLYLNDDVSVVNTITNKGFMRANNNLIIGNSDNNTDLNNIVYGVNSENLNLARGGQITAKRDINIHSKNFINNYFLNSEEGSININFYEKFENKSVYFGHDLNFEYDLTSPTFTFNIANDNKNTHKKKDGVDYEYFSESGGGDGINIARINEDWSVTTILKKADGSKVSYNMLKDYLGNSLNLAQIRADIGSVNVKSTSERSTNGDFTNHTAKIVAGNNIDIDVGEKDLNNISTSLLNGNGYVLEYMYVGDEYKNSAVVFKTNAANNDAVIMLGDKEHLDNDDNYERTWDYVNKIKNFNQSLVSDSPAVIVDSKVGVITRYDTNNLYKVMETLREYVKSKKDVEIFKKPKDENADQTSAVISAKNTLKIKAGNVTNSSTGQSMQGTEFSDYHDIPKPDFSKKQPEECDVACEAEKAKNNQSPDSNDPQDRDINSQQDRKPIDQQGSKQDGEEFKESDEKLEKEEEKPWKLDEVGDISTSVSLPEISNTYPMDKIPTVNLKLPTSADKYGPYILAKDPKADFLIESNPLYGESSDVLGSDYLREQLDITPELTTKRLGDSRYEQELVRQQIEQVTNKGVISSTIMQSYFDNAIAVNKDLGLTYGKPLTQAQIESLDKDIVWMVEKVVQGQRVLVPQVYLSLASIEKINDSGSVLEGEAGIELDVESLENNESTITGGNVVIKSEKDINNIGAQIKGKDVKLTSKSGSINNITLASHYGDQYDGSTRFGPTAGITSENSLVLDANKDINIIGANVKAGGDTHFEAGNDIKISTLQDKRASSSHGGNSQTTTRTVTHVGSQIDIGGNASIKSGNDTIISGSEFNIEGGFAAQTGGDFRLQSVQDTKETTSKSTESGFGVGGGLFGKQTTETNEFIGQNNASTLNVRGNVDIVATNQVVIEGSDLNIGSDGVSRILGVKGVAILDGKDEYRKETTVTTTTFMKLEGGDTGASAGAGAEAGSSKEDLSARASAEASAEAHAAGSLKLREQSVEVQTDTEKRGVASNVNTKGSLIIASSEGDVFIRGSEVDADKALAVKGVNVILEAGTNERTSTRTRESKSLGLHGEASAGADAGADAEASLFGASASVEANVNTGATLTAGLKTESEYDSRKEITHNKVELNAGTDMIIMADEMLLSQGVNANAGNNIQLNAKDIINRAVVDVVETESSKTSNLTGLYLGASAGAGASAEAGAGVNRPTALQPIPSASAGAEAGVNASASLEAGVRSVTTSESSYSLNTTNHGNDFNAKGNFERIAENTILDEATSFDIGGKFTQKATNVIDVAVHDVDFSTSSSSKQDIRLGLQAGVEAEAKVGAYVEVDPFGGESGTEKGAEKGKSRGMKGSYDQESSGSYDYNAKAVTTTINANSIESDVSGHMELNGTSFFAQEDVTLKAGSLTFNGAVDTKISRKSENSTNAELQIGILPEDPSFEAGFSNAKRGSNDVDVKGRGSAISGSNVKIEVKEELKDTGLKIDSNQSDVSFGKQISGAVTTISSSDEYSSGVEMNLSISGEGMEISISED